MHTNKVCLGNYTYIYISYQFYYKVCSIRSCIHACVVYEIQCIFWRMSYSSLYSILVYVRNRGTIYSRINIFAPLSIPPAGADFEQDFYIVPPLYNRYSSEAMNAFSPATFSMSHLPLLCHGLGITIFLFIFWGVGVV